VPFGIYSLRSNPAGYVHSSLQRDGKINISPRFLSGHMDVAKRQIVNNFVKSHENRLGNEQIVEMLETKIKFHSLKLCKYCAGAEEKRFSSVFSSPQFHVLILDLRCLPKVVRQSHLAPGRRSGSLLTISDLIGGDSLRAGKAR
jgi:hypothetical protein